MIFKGPFEQADGRLGLVQVQRRFIVLGNQRLSHREHVSLSKQVKNKKALRAFIKPTAPLLYGVIIITVQALCQAVFLKFFSVSGLPSQMQHYYFNSKILPKHFLCRADSFFALFRCILSFRTKIVQKNC